MSKAIHVYESAREQGNGSKEHPFATLDEAIDATAKNMSLMYELHSPDGHLYRLWLDGTTEGFPEGTIIINHARREIHYLQGLLAKANRKEGEHHD